MDKSPDAFRTISEVAGDLDLPQHVLRFWETRFSQIRPLKRGGGRRYYRPDDVDLLKGIRHLLYGEGYTIRGVQRILKEEGVRFVMDVWREGAAQPSSPGGRAADDGDDEPMTAPRSEPNFSAPPVFERYGDADEATQTDIPSSFAPVPAETAVEDGELAPNDPEVRAAHVLAQRFAPLRPLAATEGPARRMPPSFPPPPEPPAPRPVEASPSSLSRDEVRRLQATLFELLECKRLLDQVR